MKENEIIIYICVMNTIRILGFIMLAIVFQKWWISLFSTLFLIIKDNEKE